MPFLGLTIISAKLLASDNLRAGSELQNDPKLALMSV